MFYELSQVIGARRPGWSVSRHTCARGSLLHRHGDMGEEVGFFPASDPEAEQKARNLLESLNAPHPADGVAKGGAK